MKSKMVLNPNRALAVGCAAVVALVGCGPSGERVELRVTATAYNSLPGQTWGDHTEAAWGDRLEPGMRAIAVSRDLIPLGLGQGVKVRIEGLSGEYVVMDKMAARFKKRIDIYMGDDFKAARKWGRKKVRIWFTRFSDDSR